MLMTGTTPGARLVYDYIAQCWSTDTHWNFNNSGFPSGADHIRGGRPGGDPHEYVNMPLVIGPIFRAAFIASRRGLLRLILSSM